MVDIFRYRGVIWVGVSLIVALGLLPPWRYVVPESGQPITIFAGYAPLFDPPPPETRIRDFPTVSETIAARRVVNSGRFPDRAAALQREYPPQIDYGRLLLQWLMVVFVVGAWILVGPFPLRAHTLALGVLSLLAAGAIAALVEGDVSASTGLVLLLFSAAWPLKGWQARNRL
jgi:hypothetical protein